jgi:L-ribulose-5-phosphate 3-epimerase UlaE
MLRKIIRCYGQELPKICAIMLNGKVHQRPPVGSASTQMNREIQQQSIRNTTTPIMIGVRFIFLAGADAAGAGLAGTLPAYSAATG